MTRNTQITVCNTSTTENPLVHAFKEISAVTDLLIKLMKE